MQNFYFPAKNKKIVLALGAESAGNFSVYHPLPCTQGRAGCISPSPVIRGGLGRGCGRAENSIYLSQDFGDLLEENNFILFKKALLDFLRKEKITPDVILTDLHPLMKTTLWGETLAKKFRATHIKVQHHHAHIFSAIGDYLTPSPVIRGGLGRDYGEISNTFYGITMDGTGYGEDGKIWGGEIFKISNFKFQISNEIPNSKLQNKKPTIKRIGHLENQLLLGGEIAIREPARMLISILSKFISKKEVYSFVKKYYSQNEFEVLHNQLAQNFNCLETSSTGRVLDAVSLLLGFCGNERKYKHEPVDLLEAESTKPYLDLKPKIDIVESSSIFNFQFPISNQFPMTKFPNKTYILNTTYLFEYLLKNLHEDKRRLAATAQLYIAEGLYEIIKLSHHQNAGSSVPLEPHSSGKIKSQNKSKPIASNLTLPETKSSGRMPELAIIIKKHNDAPLPCTQGRAGEGLGEGCNIFSAGGLANNRIISNYLISQGAHTNKKIPRGDAGLSFGQIIYFLFQN